MKVQKKSLSEIVDSSSISLLPSRQARIEKRKRNNTQDNAGPAWFNMAAPERTPELETDLKLLSMRSAIDPKRHYRRGEKLGQSKYFQVGTIIEDATGFYGDRLTRKQRGSTMLDTLIRDTERNSYIKKKYEGLQQESMKKGRGQRPATKPWSRPNKRKK